MTSAIGGSASTEAAVDVVIVSYQSRSTIEECIRAAQEIDGLGRIVVVEHGTDGSAALAEKLGAIVVTDETNPGFGAGQNRGRALCNAPYVLILNPDSVVHPVSVTRGLEVLTSRSDTAAVQGAIVNSHDGTFERSWGRQPGLIDIWSRALGLRRLLAIGIIRQLIRSTGAFAGYVDRVPAGPIDVEFLAATAVLVRKAAIDGVGGFDQRFFLYGEDVDLCRRLRDRGWKLVALPETWAEHCWGTSSANPLDRELARWDGLLTYSALWFPAPALCAARIAALLRFASLTAQRPSVWRRAAEVLLTPRVTRR